MQTFSKLFMKVIGRFMLPTNISAVFAKSILQWPTLSVIFVRVCNIKYLY